MRRFFARLLLVLFPLAVYIGWLLLSVQKELVRGIKNGAALDFILMLLGGLFVLVVVEALIFKFYILPICARYISERIYGGSYFPDDDPLACLARKIELENRPDLLPELVQIVEADPQRVRAWLELARLLEDSVRDTPQAVQRLLQGAATVRRKEDAALLMWRAASLLRKHDQLADQAPPLLERLVREFPSTAYGKLAADFLKKCC